MATRNVAIRNRSTPKSIPNVDREEPEFAAAAAEFDGIFLKLFAPLLLNIFIKLLLPEFLGLLFFGALFFGALLKDIREFADGTALAAEFAAEFTAETAEFAAEFTAETAEFATEFTFPRAEFTAVVSVLETEFAALATEFTAFAATVLVDFPIFPTLNIELILCIIKITNELQCVESVYRNVPKMRKSQRRNELHPEPGLDTQFRSPKHSAHFLEYP